MSEEDQELLQKISKISGKAYQVLQRPTALTNEHRGHINLHKTQATPARNDLNSGLAPSRPWNRYPQALSNHPSTAPWRSSRVAPYSRGRGRGRAGRIVANPHRNRTLVLNNVSTLSLPSAGGPSPDCNKTFRSEDEEPISVQSTDRWVTKRDRHMQLINSLVYDKETQARNKAMEETRRQKALENGQREKHKIARHLKSLTFCAGQASDVAREVTIDGLRFRVDDGGSKLVRIRSKDRHQGSASVLSLTTSRHQ